MKSVVMVAAALVAVAGFCENASLRAKMEQRIQRSGGEVVRKGSFLGKVVIVNGQKRLPDADCAKVAALFAAETKCNVVLGTQADGGEVVLTVIDDPKEPKMLIAPDDRWGTVNLAKLTDDLPSDAAKQKFFASRARKYVIKALSLLLGGGASQFPGNVMNVKNEHELDTAQEALPADMTAKYLTYLSGIGVTPMQKTTYHRACREGWAPAPTNDVQKAIWDKVHTPPKSPMKIEFDPKKGR